MFAFWGAEINFRGRVYETKTFFFVFWKRGRRQCAIIEGEMKRGGQVYIQCYSI